MKTFFFEKFLSAMRCQSEYMKIIGFKVGLLSDFQTTPFPNQHSLLMNCEKYLFCTKVEIQHLSDWMDGSLIEHLEQCQQYFVLPGFIRTTCQQKRVQQTNTGPKWPFRCFNVCGLREFWNGFMYMGPYFYLVWLFVIFE